MSELQPINPQPKSDQDVWLPQMTKDEAKHVGISTLGALAIGLVLTHADTEPVSAADVASALSANNQDNRALISSASLTPDLHTALSQPSQEGGDGNPPDLEPILLEIESTGSINVRPDAGTSKAAVGSIDNGDVVDLIGIVDDGQSIEGDTTWYQIEFGPEDNRNSGWVSGFLVHPGEEQLDQLYGRIAHEIFQEPTPVPPTPLSGPPSPDHIQPVAADSGGVYPWATQVTEGARQIIDNTIEESKAGIASILQAQDIEDVDFAVTWNGEFGDDWTHNILPFNQNPDGSTTVYWPTDGANNLMYNSSVWNSGDFVSFNIPADMDLASGFNDGNVNPYLVVTTNNIPLGFLDTSRPLSENDPYSQFSLYPERTELSEAQLQAVLSGQNMLEDFGIKFSPPGWVEYGPQYEQHFYHGSDVPAEHIRQLHLDQPLSEEQYNSNRLMLTPTEPLPIDYVNIADLQPPYNQVATQLLEVSLIYRGTIVEAGGNEAASYFEWVDPNTGTRKLVNFHNDFQDLTNGLPLKDIKTSLTEQSYPNGQWEYGPELPGYDAATDRDGLWTRGQATQYIMTLPIGTQVLYRHGTSIIEVPEGQENTWPIYQRSNQVAQNLFNRRPIPSGMNYELHMNWLVTELMFPSEDHWPQ